MSPRFQLRGFASHPAAGSSGGERGVNCSWGPGSEQPAWGGHVGTPRVRLALLQQEGRPTDTPCPAAITVFPSG